MSVRSDFVLIGVVGCVVNCCIRCGRFSVYVYFESGWLPNE
jgi:hypothetical protein